MNNRNQEKYKVYFANTNRLKNSSVMTMQKLLKEEQWIVHIVHCHGELWLSIDIRLNSPIAEIYLILSYLKGSGTFYNEKNMFGNFPKCGELDETFRQCENYNVYILWYGK